jgi:hypothetical protein
MRHASTYDPTWYDAFRAANKCTIDSCSVRQLNVFGAVTKYCIGHTITHDPEWYDAYRAANKCTIDSCSVMRQLNVFGAVPKYCIGHTITHDPEWYDAYRKTVKCVSVECKTTGTPHPDGMRRRITCAIADGTVIIVKGASKIACRFFDDLSTKLGIKIPHLHLDSTSGMWSGSEKKGLVPGRNYRPDGYDTKKIQVWLYHGNAFHGYPPDHPDHDCG